jgi:hypothetical protein
MRRYVMMVMAGAALSGCATSSNKTATATPAPTAAVAVSAPARESAKPMELGGDAVKIVAHRPSSKEYKYVGRIEATAKTSDVVDAAVAADAELQRQAKALGADVVKLDVVAAPKKGRVVLAGKAYKKTF